MLRYRVDARGFAGVLNRGRRGSWGGAPREGPARNAAEIRDRVLIRFSGCFLEGKGAGEAGMRVRARARDRAGPCAHAGRSGATRSGNRSPRSGTEDRFGEEDGADSGPGLSAGATRARAWERRLRRGPCWQAGEAGGLRGRAGRGELGRALGPS